MQTPTRTPHTGSQWATSAPCLKKSSLSMAMVSAGCTAWQQSVKDSMSQKNMLVCSCQLAI